MMTLMDHACLGKKLEGELVIDVHAHLGPWYNFFIPQNDADGMIGVMDHIGVDVVCPCSHACIGPDFILGNDLAAEAIQKYPGRFAPYIGVNPNYPDGVADEIERCRQKGMKNVKMHSMHKVPYDDSRYAPAFEIANDLGWAVLAHTWGNDAKVFVKLGETYPNAKFLLGHSGVVDFGAYVEAANARENVFLDLATSQVGYNWVEAFVERVGADRVLFGSDIPFIALAPQIGQVLCARISDDDKRDILGLNAKHVLGIDSCDL
ncbi:MAG: amidohydrolase family protein [Planctomycetes bacterium]|nr:amidohydrolase family protein [Planctomycetota bacterium]